MQLRQIDNGFMMCLAPKVFWASIAENKNGVYWEDCKEWLIYKTQEKADFNTDQLTGRGADKYIDNNGNEQFCYFDGYKTWGIPNPNRIFIRKNRRDIGLDYNDDIHDITYKICNMTKYMTFCSLADRIRLLSWSVLSPFAGALPWRPACLMTGSSGSGKTWIKENIIDIIAQPLSVTGYDTSGAGLRQGVGNDAISIVIEESDARDKKSKWLKEEQLSIMRQSTSDNSPIALKGTKDQSGPIGYRMRSMFMFLAIDPEIGIIADENRIHRINLKSANKEEEKYFLDNIVHEMKSILSKENGKKICSFTWKHLKQIINEAYKIEPILRQYSTREARYTLSDSLLLSAYFVVFINILPTSDMDYLKAIIETYYKTSPVESQRDMSDETLTLLLDDKILIDLDGTKKERSISQLLDLITNKENTGYENTNNINISERENIIATLEGRGLKIIEFNGKQCLAISNGNAAIARILGRTISYHKILNRHVKCISSNKQIKIGGNNKRCTVLDILE